MWQDSTPHDHFLEAASYVTGPNQSWIWLLSFANVGFPGVASGEEPAYQCRRVLRKCRFDLWGGKVPRWRARQSTPLLFPGEFSRTEDPGKLQFMGS